MSMETLIKDNMFPPSVGESLANREDYVLVRMG